MTAKLLDLLIYGEISNRDEIDCKPKEGGWDVQTLSQIVGGRPREVRNILQRLIDHGKVERFGAYFFHTNQQR